MYSKRAIVNNGIGLHAKAATLFIAKANTYKSAVLVEKNDRKINGKSLLGVLAMGIAGGEEIVISAEGPDEIVAVDTLCALVESDFAE